MINDTNLTQILNDAAEHTKLGEYRLTRDEALDLSFDGWKVAVGRCGDRAHEADWTRWTVVALYVTTSGKFVTSIERHSRWQGQGSRYDASVHDSFAEAVAYVREENDGRLGPASKKMVEDAVSNIPSLAGADVERV
jgi:hypothetical protein